MCEVYWETGHPYIWLNIISGCDVSVRPEAAGFPPSLMGIGVVPLINSLHFLPI